MPVRKNPKKGKLKRLNSRKVDKEFRYSNFDANISKLKIPCKRYEKFHDNFLTYHEIEEFLRKTAQNNTNIIDIITIGHSRKGKKLYLVSISSESAKDSNAESTKFITLIVAGLNGQDLFAVSNAIYAIDSLCKNQNILKLMNYFIIPCCNPDAYEEIVESKIISTRSKNDKTDKNKSNKCETKKSKSDETIINRKNISNCSKDLCRKSKTSNIRQSTSQEENHSNNKRKCKKVNLDLSLNFPVFIGLGDLSNIPTKLFISKLAFWKENYIYNSPETLALLNVIKNCKFAVKLLITLNDSGESISYPFGYPNNNLLNNDEILIKEIAKKGKCAIKNRNFQYGSIYDTQGFIFGNLIDYLATQEMRIKFMYNIQVHKNDSSKNCDDMKKLLIYGCDIIECIKKMSTSVYKSYTNVNQNFNIELVSCKALPNIKKKFP